MEILKLTLFGIGTLAFFCCVYLAVQNPELVEAPIGEESPTSEMHPLKKYDTLISYVMWGAWGLTALVIYLDKNGYLEAFDL